MKDSNALAPLIDFHLEDIWPILRKQRNVILLFLGTVLITTLVGGLLRTREYRATALIHLSPHVGQEVAVSEVVDMNTRGYFEVQQFYRTQIQIILSRSVREEVIRRYQALGYDDVRLEDDGARVLSGMMAVVPEEQSQLVDISVVHTDPEQAAILANLIAEVYSDRTLANRRDASSNAVRWLEGQIEDYGRKVSDSTEALHAYKGEADVVDIEARLNTLDARLGALNAALAEKSTEQALLETTLQGHEDLRSKGRYDQLAKVLSSPLLETASRDLASALAHHADVAARYGPQHPEFRQSDARVKALEGSIHDEIDRLVAGEHAALQQLVATTGHLAEEVADRKTDMLVYQRKASEYDALQKDLQRAQAFYEKLSSRLEEVSLTAETQLNNVDIVDRAVAPETPYKPNIPMSMMVALLVGVVGGIGLALVREYVDDTISSQLDVAAHLKVPFLGLIPRLPDGIQATEADLFTHYNPRSSVAEAVRGLRAMLEMNPNGPAPRRILVTSSVAREGKTSTAIRLGVSFAQMGRRVVIVDADLRRPRVHKVFGADNTVGLSSFLVGAATVDELPTATPVPNLYAIYSGASTDQPAELMASQRMEDLLTGLEARFDIILLDTPPSVALSDAVTLSRRVDGILLVVKEQAVSRAVAKQTIDLLNQVEANILGVVLNNVDLQRGGTKYKYYYAYRDYYSSYGPEQKEADKAAK
ncbi:MAG TPA: polysaccharide biosynthesis tyrosine autokinase [Myxococcota bacterium]|nr:polysaccharide biosynthesis tyrosine autokinase [Myxococcota bacterium]